MSDETFFIKPAEGRLVRDELTLEKLKPEGEHKPKSVYFLRRVRDGDAIEVTPEAEAQPTASPRRQTVKE